MAGLTIFSFAASTETVIEQSADHPPDNHDGTRGIYVTVKANAYTLDTEVSCLCKNDILLYNKDYTI